MFPFRKPTFRTLEVDLMMHQAMCMKTSLMKSLNSRHSNLERILQTKHEISNRTGNLSNERLQKRLTLPTKHRVYHCCVKSICLYGSETILQGDATRLEASHMSKRLWDLDHNTGWRNATRGIPYDNDSDESSTCRAHLCQQRGSKNKNWTTERNNLEATCISLFLFGKVELQQITFCKFYG